MRGPDVYTAGSYYSVPYSWFILQRTAINSVLLGERVDVEGLRQSYYFVQRELLSDQTCKGERNVRTRVPRNLINHLGRQCPSVVASRLSSHVHLHVRRGYALLNFRCIFSHAVNDTRKRP